MTRIGENTRIKAAKRTNAAVVKMDTLGLISG